MKHATFLEVMAGPEGINLNHSQKRVLKKTVEAGDPQMAAGAISGASDNRNLVAASKTLSKYGYITTTPPVLGPDDEPQTIELTDKGQQAIEDFEIMDDPELVTDDEKEESAPEGQPPVADDSPEAGAADMPELGGEELEGPGVGLELSSFFRDINGLASLKS